MLANPLFMVCLRLINWESEPHVFELWFAYSGLLWVLKAGISVCSALTTERMDAVVEQQKKKKSLAGATLEHTLGLSVYWLTSERYSTPTSKISLTSKERCSWWASSENQKCNGRSDKHFCLRSLFCKGEGTVTISLVKGSLNISEEAWLVLGFHNLTTFMYFGTLAVNRLLTCW